MKKRSIRLLLSALLVLVMAFQSFAAPLSYAGPTAASEPAKITGTWSTDASGSWRFNAPDGAAKDGWYYLNTTNNATDYNWFCFDANGVMRTGWVPDKNDPSVWYYTGETKDSSEGGLVKGWITDPQDGKRYYLDPSTGIMCHGWKQIDGVWYYFTESRYADRGWVPDTKGYWMDKATGRHSHGSLYMNEYTPDGYYVGANGAWVQNHSEDDNSEKPDPAPETRKLSEILPSGFPTSADFAWVNEGGKKAYKDGENIKVGNLTLGKDTTATKSGDNYVCKSGDATVTFNVKDGAVESITVTGSSDSNGTYTAPAVITFDENPFEPGNIKAIQTLTIKGKNLDLVTKVIFCDNVEVTNFKSQSSEQIVIEKFPAKARTGKVTLVNGTTSQEVTSDMNLVVAQPSVSEIYQFTGVTPYQKLTINGENFDLVYDAIIGDDTYLDYTVKNEGHTIEITMPDEVHDGTVKVIAYSGVEVTVATVTTSTPATTHTVTFNLNGATGTAPTSQKIKDGEKVTKPTDPTFANHTFAGWYKTKDATTGALSDPWDFDNDTVTADMTLYAQWTTIISKIVGTNTGIPTVANFDWSNPATASIPENAWVTDDGKKAFWVPGDNGGFAILHTTVTEDQTIIQVFGLDDTDTFTKVGDTYVLSTAQFTATCTMADGKFTSLTFAGIDLSALGVMDSSIFDGTYTAPAAPAFKAVYDTTNDANTLTFYYDNKDHSGENITVYDNLPTAATKQTDWDYNSHRNNIKSVVIDDSVADYKGLKSTAYMFQGMTKATEISGAEYLDVSNVTDMSLMFMNFGGGSTNSHTTLNSVPDVSKWNTANVTNMTGMFWDYGNFSDNLTKVPDVSKWNTANVTNMAGMFQQYGYSSINFNDVPKVSGWSTVSVEDMSTMFRYYGKNSTALAAVPDVCNWNTANVTTMAEMFREYGASSTVLKAVPDVSGWNTSNVTTMINLFQNYGKGSVDFVLDLSGWDLSKITSNKGDKVFDFTPNTFNVTIPAKTGEKSNEGGKWYYGDGTNYIAPPEGKNFTPAAPEIKYMDWDAEKKELVEKSVLEDATTEVTSTTTTLDAGKFYVVKGADVQTGTLTVNGTTQSPTTLILMDGAKLTATGGGNYKAGINVATDRALVITGQSGCTGKLIATGGYNGAGIGGGANAGQDSGNITINGGDITATGGEDSAGIGGGLGSGGNTTINGGKVNATGGSAGAGIGGGSMNGGIVTINGGDVTATGGGEYGTPGIGGYCDGANVTINGGRVTAIATEDAEAIGKGAGGANSGTVTFGGENFTIYAGADKDNTKSMTTAEYSEDHSAAYVSIEESAAPPSKLLKSSGTSSDPVNDAPMAETEVSEPTVEVFEPEFEPEKFEEAKPEELIEPAEAVAEEAAP